MKNANKNFISYVKHQETSSFFCFTESSFSKTCNYIIMCGEKGRHSAVCQDAISEYGKR